MAVGLFLFETNFLQLFALLFFAMLFILGVGSLIALQGSAFTVIMDHFPHWKKWYVSLGCAVSGFLIGLIYCTPVSCNNQHLSQN